MKTAGCLLFDNTHIDCLPDGLRGNYILFLQLSKEQIIIIGKLSGINFSRGFYAYVGSAMGGIKTRLGSHLNRGGRRHWHIDYLAEKAQIKAVIIYETEHNSECALAQALGSQFVSIQGFGASDCRCQSHLFFDNNEERVMAGVLEAIVSLKVSTSG